MKIYFLSQYYNFMAKHYSRKAAKAKDPVARTYYTQRYWQYFNKGVGQE